MPLYEYRCQTCDTRFEARRTVDDADAPLPCPDGHLNAVRLLSVFAATGRAPVGGSLPAGRPAAGGAPCGPSCMCHPG
jgi:putative FmdB family regulatory protein